MMRPVNVQPHATFEVAGQRQPYTDTETPNPVDPGDIDPGVKASIERHWLWELMSQPDLLRPPRELFPGLAYEGIHTLFAGREKLGKSEIIGLVAARAQTEAPIVYFSFEEHLRELVGRATRYGVDPKRLCIVESINQLQDIRAVIEDEGAELAIIDSLTALMRSQLGITDSENSDTWGGYVQQLTAMAHEVDASILTSHHATKETGSYRGHSSIGAGADLLVEMFKDKKSESQRRFHSKGRVRGVKVPGLTWTGSLYRLETDTEDGRIRKSVRTLLHTEPGLSGSRISQNVTFRRSDVLRVVNQMFTEGELRDLNDNPRNRAFVNADEGARFPDTDVTG